MRRIRKNGKQGRGMAITGIVVGSVGILYLLFMTVFIVAAIRGDWGAYDDSYSSGTSQGDGADPYTDDQLPSYSLRTDLLVGDCLDYYAYEPDMRDATVVSCATPHEGEVVALITMSGPQSTSASEYDPVWEDAFAQCDEQTSALLGDQADLGYNELYAPHPDDFASGGDVAYCTFFAFEDLFTGSAVEHTLTSQPTPGSST